MYFNFETILTLVTLSAGIIWLVDSLFFAKKRLVTQGVLNPQAEPGFLTRTWLIFVGPKVELKMPLIIEYARSFFPVLLLVLCLRSFVYEPYRIPSGSDEPTLLIGDLILVNKHIYGIRLPVLGTKIIKTSEPKLGDIMVFRYPVDPGIDLIKRVIGLPGDKISYIDKVVYINGIKAPQELQGEAVDDDGSGTKWPVTIKREDLLGVSHLIYQRLQVPPKNFEVTVPKGEYFVLGDNRDDSLDSRYWGFVPEENLVGKATAVFLSWNGFKGGILHLFRWSRSGTKIH